MREYTMTDRIYRMIKTKGTSLKCGRCSEELKAGDKVVSKITQRTKTKRYHKSCWEKGYV